MVANGRTRRSSADSLRTTKPLADEPVERPADGGGGEAEPLGDAGAGHRLGSEQASSDQRADLGDGQVVLLDRPQVVGLGVEHELLDEDEELLAELRAWRWGRRSLHSTQ